MGRDNNKNCRYIIELQIIIENILPLKVLTKMPLAVSPSCVISLAIPVLLFSGMQMAKPLLVASQPATILGGFLGSILFVFLLTGLGNLEKIAFGYGFQTKLPETLFCLMIAVVASASVHRVSAT